MIASTRRLTSILSALSACALIGGTARASMVWFDETQGGGRSVSDFAELSGAYADFTAGADSIFTFNNLGAGTELSDQYASQGVTFANTSSTGHKNSLGVRPEGGKAVDDLTGYDGTYMPDGDSVYVKFNNDDVSAPFTVNFDAPVGMVGAFVSMGVQGTVHTLTIAAYDSSNELLGQHTVQSWLWEADPSKQNYESFFAVSDSEARISRVEILNDAPVNFANTLIFDNLAFSASPAPEPATWLMLLGGTGLFWLRGRTNGSRRVA